MYYLISIFCMLMYGTFLPFNYISSSFFIHSWYDDKVTDESLKRAGEAMGIPFLISGILVPLIGFWVDKNGKRATLMLFSAFLVLTSFILFMSFNPIYGLICFGISFSLFAAIVWPAITLVVPKKLIGFALGLTTSLQNTSMSIFPIIVAFIFNSSGSYNETLTFFVFISLISVCLGCCVISHDKNMDNCLEREDPENANFELLNKMNK